MKDGQPSQAEILPAILAEYQRYTRYGYFAAETADGSFVGRIAVLPVIMNTGPNGL